jgi:hypothetical protein
VPQSPVSLIRSIVYPSHSFLLQGSHLLGFAVRSENCSPEIVRLTDLSLNRHPGRQGVFSPAGTYISSEISDVSVPDRFIFRMMRRTGKFKLLTIIAITLAIFSTTLIAMWNYHTSEYDLYLDIVPGGFGLTGAVNTTFIVSLLTLVTPRAGLKSPV